MKKDFLSQLSARDIILWRKRRSVMKMKKVFKSLLGANLMIIVTFAFLPALLINPDFEAYQSVLNFLNKE